jgi:hypothetical protein
VRLDLLVVSMVARHPKELGMHMKDSRATRPLAIEGEKSLLGLT